MSFVLAQTHGSGSADSREGSITHRLKGLFQMPSKRQESRRPGKHSRPSTLRNIAHEGKVSGEQECTIRKSSFCEEIPVSPARFSIRSEFRDVRRRSLERVLFPARAHLTQSSISIKEVFDTPERQDAAERALSIPEIVEGILLQLEDPVSLSATTTKTDRPAEDRPSGPLFACLTVNTLFNWAAKRVISRRVTLHDLDRLDAYTRHSASQDGLCRDLLIHRVKTCEQEQFERISQLRLRSLELYVCPKLIPTAAMLASGTLLKIALPGCALADDTLMHLIARTCKKLEILDLRACELVSDEGILAIARNCPALTYLNVGRIKRSDAITDRSITQICKLTAVETLGLAGCAITDETVLAVARDRGRKIERLSMNQCRRITDIAICELLRSAPRLQVLEVVGCERLQDAKTMCFFRLSTGALVETSELFAAEMQLFEREVKHELDSLKLRASSARSSARRVTA